METNSNKIKKQENETKNIVVIGGGLMGVLTTYYLKQVLDLRSASSPNKYNIIVLESLNGVANKTSYGNAGRFCPSSISLSNIPGSGNPLKFFLPPIIRDSITKDEHVDPALPNNLKTYSKATISKQLTNFGIWRIINGMDNDINKAKKTQGKLAMAALAIQTIHDVLEDHTGLNKIIERRPGTIYLYGTKKQFNFYNSFKIKQMVSNGYYDTKSYNSNECFEKYSWLKDFKKGTLYAFPGCSVVNHDWTADALKFTLHIASKLMMNSSSSSYWNGRNHSTNVTFRYNTRVEKLIYETIDDKNVEKKLTCIGVAVNSDGIKAKRDENIIKCDHVIVCAGLWTPRFILSNVPIQGMQGYSIDLLGCTIGNKSVNTLLPNIGIADQGSNELYFQVTPYKDKNRIRIVGYGNFRNTLPLEDEDNNAENVLLNYFNISFPNIKYKEKTKIWKGLRPMSPDDFPLIGKDIKTTNVYMNCGQGPWGWTLSSMSGYLMSLIFARDVLGERIEDEKNVSNNNNINLLLELVDPKRFNGERTDDHTSSWSLKGLLHLSSFIKK